MGTEWEQGAQQAPNGAQLALRIDRKLQMDVDEAALRDLFRRMRDAAGLDVYAFAAELGEELTYASKISEAENGVKGRHIQLRWFAPLLAYPAALEVFAAYACARAKKKPPEDIEALSAADAEADALEEVKASPELRELLRRRIAKRRGVAESEVPL